MVFDKQTAEEGLDALEAFVKECGLPTKMGQLRSKAEITPEVLRKVADICNIIKCTPPPHPHPGRSVRYPDGVHVKEPEENAMPTLCLHGVGIFCPVPFLAGKSVIYSVWQKEC